jgi:uncharacterized repeat protein (TIGR02543 family)
MIANAYTIADALATALKADAVLSAACTAAFGKQPHYYIGFDSYTPPAASMLPFIVVAPGSTNVEDDVYARHVLLIACVVNAPAITATTGLTKYPGYSTAAQFETSVFEAIARYFDEKTATHHYSLLSWTPVQYANHYPEYHATRELTTVSPAVQHTVTFNSNGGSAVASQIIDDNNLATSPTAPTKTGSTFAGWYSDAALTAALDFSATVINSDVTLYAKWA